MHLDLVQSPQRHPLLGLRHDLVLFTMLRFFFVFEKEPEGIFDEGIFDEESEGIFDTNIFFGITSIMWEEYEELQLRIDDIEDNIHDLRDRKEEQDDRRGSAAIDKQITALTNEKKKLKKTMKGMLKGGDYRSLLFYDCQMNESEPPEWKKQADREVDDLLMSRKRKKREVFVVSDKEEDDDEKMEEIIVLNSEAMEADGDADAVQKLLLYTDKNDAANSEKPARTVSMGILHGDLKIRHSRWNKLMPHQRTAVEMMLHRVGMLNKGCVIAHAMGLGKTLTVLTFLQSVYMRAAKTNTTLKIIVTAPKTLLYNWYHEYQKWRNHTDITFHLPLEKDNKVLVNLWSRDGGVLLMGHDRFRMMQRDLDPDILVVDEAHLLLKRATNEFYQAVNACAATRILVTGSPLENHVREYLTMIGLCGETMNSTFEDKLAAVIEKGSVVDATPEDIANAMKSINTLSLYTKEYMHRQSREVLRGNLRVQKSEYKLVYDFDPGSYDLSTGSIFARTQDTRVATQGAKIDIACCLVDSIFTSNPDDAIIIFSQRKDTLKRMAGMRKGDIIDGDVLDPSTRHQMADRFQEGHGKILYMSSKIACGLTLTRANRVILLDAAWNPMEDVQAIYRCYRYGQIKPVVIYRFVAHKSIEEYIYMCAVQKYATSIRIIEESDVCRLFTMEQLRELKSFGEEEEHLKHTEDCALNTILPQLRYCSSHDVLFAQTDERLTVEQELASRNEYNLFTQKDDRYFDGHGKISPSDIYFQDGSLVPPYPIVWCNDELTHSIDGYRLSCMPIRPSNKFIKPKYEVQYGKSCDAKECVHNESYDYEAGFFDWGLYVDERHTGLIRIRVRMIVDDLRSDWSIWSEVFIPDTSADH